MKKIFFLALVTVMLAACKEDSPDNPKEQSNAAFAKATLFEALGMNTVPNVEGENKDQPFKLDNVRVEAKIVSENTLDLYLYGINFSSKMFVTIDMVIPSANYTRTADKITITGENIVPMIGDNSFDRYIITNLRGTITAESLVFTNNYGTYAGCSYEGRIVKMEEQK